jgi:protein TonB
MNHRFTLPVALALAAHASLLFGFRHSAPVKDPNSKPNSLPAIPTIRVDPIELPRDESPDVSGPAKSLPTTEVARSPEPPPTATDRSIFVIDAPPVSKTWSPDVTFDPQPPGVPDGIVGGVGGPAIWGAGSLDRTPKAQVQFPPDYPFAAKREGLDGEVLVEFIVDETGRVLSPHVVRSTNAVFEEASLRAVAKWRFEPGRRDSQIVRFRMSVPVVFHLNRG